MKAKIQLSDHFTYGKLLRFTLPSIVMMVFTSIYSVVDGFFISNFAGKTAFAALNLIWPFLMILGGMGFMIGTGGTALVSRCLGAGERDKALRVAEKLASLGRTKQVLCVTHLPQLAALADTHFRIAKREADGRTYTSVTPLDFEGRRQELARIIGGANITETPSPTSSVSSVPICCASCSLTRRKLPLAR